MNGAPVIRWWQGLGARERLFVTGGVVLVVAMVVWAALWEPAATGIRKLQGDLPTLRAEAASMRAMADESVRLRTAAGDAAPTAPAGRLAAVRRSLERAGLWSTAAPSAATSATTPAPPVRTLSVDGSGTTQVSLATVGPTTRTSPPELTDEGGRVRVRFDDVDYGVWAGWLAAAETELAARAARVSVTSVAPKGPVGHVRADALLDWTAAASSSASSSPAASAAGTRP